MTLFNELCIRFSTVTVKLTGKCFKTKEIMLKTGIAGRKALVIGQCI